MVPLADNNFNRSKSNIKFLEYSVCGFPAVYSDVGPYHSSVVQGETGLLTRNTPEDWFINIETLVKDPGLRSRIAMNARNEILSCRRFLWGTELGAVPCVKLRLVTAFFAIGRHSK
jgi:glycosyltransferase involved in cell wall biosynthesis